MKHLLSTSVDIDHPEMKQIFKGMAIYNNGTIAFAYRVPIICEAIEFGECSLTTIPIVITPGNRVTLNMRIA